MHSLSIQMKHYNITVTGRVQGVGFRNSVNRQARYLGIKGYVKNEFDGSVYIEAEGVDIELIEFVKWIKGRHSLAHVDNVSISVGQIAYFSIFEARY